jgi:3-oxoacyl-[acyl-carrier-protein] synthase III
MESLVFYLPSMIQKFGAGVAVVGSGSATPTQILSNSQLSDVVDTSDEWIATRTGIRQRRLLDPQTSLVDLAAQASQNALNMAGLTPQDVDLIILATSTAEDLFGSANQVQARLGAFRAVGFDLTAACSGFVFGLVTAAQFIQSGTYRTVLVIGADIMSRWVDWQDRRTCVLFGDGAGAMVLQASEHQHLLGYELRSDGSQNHCLNLAYAPQPHELTSDVVVSQGRYQPISMDGREVYRFAVQRVPEIIEKVLFHADIKPEQVDWLVLHQANQRILDAIAQRLKIDNDKVVSNLANYGNTSAASIPLAIDEWVRQDKIKPGHTVAISGFGAGLTWGAAAFIWG